MTNSKIKYSPGGCCCPDRLDPTKAACLWNGNTKSIDQISWMANYDFRQLMDFEQARLAVYTSKQCVVAGPTYYNIDAATGKISGTFPPAGFTTAKSIAVQLQPYVNGEFVTDDLCQSTCGNCYESPEDLPEIPLTTVDDFLDRIKDEHHNNSDCGAGVMYCSDNPGSERSGAEVNYNLIDSDTYCERFHARFFSIGAIHATAANQLGHTTHDYTGSTPYWPTFTADTYYPTPFNSNWTEGEKTWSHGFSGGDAPDFESGGTFDNVAWGITEVANTTTNGTSSAGFIDWRLCNAPDTKRHWYFSNHTLFNLLDHIELTNPQYIATDWYGCGHISNNVCTCANAFYADHEGTRTWWHQRHTYVADVKLYWRKQIEWDVEGMVENFGTNEILASECILRSTGAGEIYGTSTGARTLATMYPLSYWDWRNGTTCHPTSSEKSIAVPNHALPWIPRDIATALSSASTAINKLFGAGFDCQQLENDGTIKMDSWCDSTIIPYLGQAYNVRQTPIMYLDANEYTVESGLAAIQALCGEAMNACGPPITMSAHGWSPWVDVEA